MEKKHAKTPKEKRRNMERRKEKSRDAARNRRGRETEIFTDLMALLPLSSTKVANLDKASVIRIAISYLKIRAVIQSLPTKENESAEIDGFNMDSLFVDSLEGFLLVTSTEGDIVFISENVNRYLGLQQMEVLGQSIYELSHPCDHAEIKEMLSTKDVNVQKSYFLRMKWNPKGRSVNVSKNAQYKVIQYTGRVIQSQPKVGEDEVNNNSSTGTACGDANKIVSNVPAYHFVAIGEAIWHPANIEVPLGRNTFLSKHSLDMKYTYADERIVDFFGYNPEALIKKSIYDYHHAQDTVVIKNCFKNLFEKGQSQTERYRFLALGGGYAWVVTQSTLIYSNNQKPLSVVCVNFIVSEIENKNEIYALCQLDNTCTSLTEADCSPSVSDNADDGYLYENSPQHLIEKLRINTNPSPLVAATAKAAAAAAATTTSAKNRYSPLTPTASHQRSPSNAVVKKKPAKNQKQKSNILPVLPGLDIEEFLLNSTPPPSASPQSCGSRSPESRLNDQWLMSDGPEEAAFYALTVPSTDTAPATVEIDETDDVEEQIKIETIRGSDDSVKPSDIPKPATVNVFVPFTEEMNKGFLGFTEDDTGLTMLKEDPEDLTHLAPTAGDVCVPLDENPIDYVLPDMLDEIMLSDCNLLSSDTDRDLSSSSPNSFFSYRDDLEPSSRPLSPILTQNEDCSIPSFCSDDSSLHGNPVNHFLDFGLISTSDEMDDLSGKPSYIPLSLDQDPLLPFVTNDFMWGSSSGESSTWSSVPSSPTSNCSLSPRLDHTSSLAKLLKAEPICNYDGGGSDRSDVHGGGGATKNSFGNSVNSLADRNYSNVGNFKTVAYHRNINGINESNRRRTNAVKKETNNNRSEDKRKASQVTIGSKRSMSENWGRGANSCKRSKQTSRTIIINGGGGGNNRRVQESAAMAEAVATAKQTNSVLMNLLVSGCDLNAGYDEDLKDASRRVCSSVNNNKNSANRLNYEMKNDSVDVPDSKCWSPFKRKSVSLLESESSQIPSLMDLTEQDYAVNAPSAGEILQGSDLLKALECATII